MILINLNPPHATKLMETVTTLPMRPVLSLQVVKCPSTETATMDKKNSKPSLTGTATSTTLSTSVFSSSTVNPSHGRSADGMKLPDFLSTASQLSLEPRSATPLKL